MEVMSVRVFEGPNIYSLHPVVKVVLDIGAYEDRPSNELEGLVDRLVQLLPGLYDHYCSYGRPGGFVQRLRDGTYMAHIFEHVALELQCAVGYQVGFGKTRSTGKPGIYDVIIAYLEAEVALKAVRAANAILNAVLTQAPFDMNAVLAELQDVAAKTALGPSTAAICQAAAAKGVPVNRIEQENLLVLGYGRRQQRIWATLTGRTSALGSDLACDKQLTKQVLARGGIPVPEGMVVTSEAAAEQARQALGRPVVVKPLGGNHGNGVTLNVQSHAELARAFALALPFDKQVIVEEYLPGRQYRMCVVNGKLIAAAERIPAYVIGDGVHTVTELISLVNANPLRGDGHTKPLTKIMLDAAAIIVLVKQGITPETIPASDQVVYIRETSNLSTGGTAVDVTDIVHPTVVTMAERAARLVGLDVAGVDVIVQDITKPMTPGTGAVIEVNAAPGIRMHHYPTAGKPRNVAGAIVDYLFPDKADGRIPIVAITGTNGKTTATRMIGHIWQLAGYNVGMTTTDGIFINGQCVMPGDTTGPRSARVVLADPTVEVAVLETARGGIMRGGLAYDASDVGVVTNITEDHLGQDGIEDLDDLAFIKSLVVETVKPGGVALLNADDQYVAAMAGRVRSEVVYFSLESDNIIVRRHLGAGGRAFFVKDGNIYAAQGSVARFIVRVKDIPVTLGGIALHNLQNAVIAAAACYSMRVPIAYIRQGLSSFDSNPGRLNLLDVGDIRICVDYGHNPAGYQALISTVRRLGAKRLVGVIAAPGDRRDDVIVNIGRIAGRGFDYIYIKEDRDRRGRQSGATAALLRQGVLEHLPADRVEVILNEAEAMTRAIQSAQSGDLIVVFYEQYATIMATIEQVAQSRAASDKPEPETADNDQLIVAGVKTL